MKTHCPGPYCLSGGLLHYYAIHLFFQGVVSSIHFAMLIMVMMATVNITPPTYLSSWQIPIKFLKSIIGLDIYSFVDI